MPFTLEVNITVEDIRKGKEGDCNLCPVALAVDRALNHPMRWCAVHGGGRVFLYRSTPPPFTQYAEAGNGLLADFISKFDKGEQVEPLSVTLEFE